MARILTVYTARDHELTDMSYIRWYKISEALARQGHNVDIAVGSPEQARQPIRRAENLRKVLLSDVHWDDYDVIKAIYMEGFATTERYGGREHPFIISRLGTVVGPHDMDGIPFCGERRKHMYKIQEAINLRGRFIAFLNHEARQLWTDCFGRIERMLIVPGAVDQTISPAKSDPFPADSRSRCLFAGHLYSKWFAPEANVHLTGKLNELGKLLVQRGVRLYVIGSGDASALDPRHTTYLGVVPYDESWSYLSHAHVGVELIKCSRFMHNNESSKIYHYLRAGLPVVSERGLPNSSLITEARLGFLVDVGDLATLADRVEEATKREWPHQHAIRLVLDRHTWDKRAEVYDKLIRDTLNV